MNGTTEHNNHRRTTETHCHCGAEFRGCDHCPVCFCEQYEAICDHEATREELEDQRIWNEVLGR